MTVCFAVRRARFTNLFISPQLLQKVFFIFKLRNSGEDCAKGVTTNPMGSVFRTLLMVYLLYFLILQRALRPWLWFQRAAAGRGFRCTQTLYGYELAYHSFCRNFVFFVLSFAFFSRLISL